MKLVEQVFAYAKAEVEKQLTSCNTEVVVYSACFGGVDELNFGGYELFDGVTCVIFVDTLGIAPPGWIEIVISKSIIGDNDPRLVAKVFKVLPHLIFENKFDISLWIDANIKVKNPVLDYVSAGNIRLNDVAVFNHNKRSNIYTEGMYCWLFGKDRFRVILTQLLVYSLLHLRASFSLYQGRIILRKHNKQDVGRAMDKWWAEIEKGSIRDQLSLPIALRMMKDRVSIVPHEKLEEFFDVNDHLIYEFRSKSSLSPLLLKLVGKIYGR